MAQKSTRPGFGIDFGTTNSVVAVAIGDKRPEPLLGPDGLPHPSIVWYGPSKVTVGADAKRQFHTYAERTGHRFIRSVKQELGRERSIDTGGERRPAHEIATEIFKHLRTDAARNKWLLDEAVLSVPVYFDGLQRADIRSAAEDAGIKVMNLVHEPFAAVVGYYQSIGLNLRALPEETILVFDWGGGTLDTTIVRSQDGLLMELATGGLVGTAGDLFDEYIEKYARNHFLHREKIPPESFRPSRPTLDRLNREAERVKIELSERPESVISVAHAFERGDIVLDLEVPIQRQVFDDLIAARVDEALAEVHRMLRDSRLQPDAIDRALLIGGTSEIPLIRDEMEKLFDVRAQPVPNTQTVIAEGAAVIAREALEPILAAPVQIELSNRTIYTVLARGTRVPDPAGKQVSMFCTDNRDGEARLILRQGDGARERYQEVLSIPVVAGQPRPYNHESVETTFQVDENLILKVSGYGAAKGEVAEVSIYDLKFGLRLR
jgi:molecular chaperone DnaK